MTLDGVIAEARAKPPKAAVGRIVHAYIDDEGPFAAIITAVDHATYCTLAVFKPNQTSNYSVDKVAHQNVALSGWPYWVWPPRE